MSDVEFALALQRVVDGECLDVDEAAGAFDAIMSGAVEESVVASFLTALATRKITVDEIVGAARTMRAKMQAVEAPPEAIDLCGTGGDAKGTLNISTASAFVVAGAGVPVAKHGNRGMSSKSGGADVLEALGVRLQVDAHAAAASLRSDGICFLFAQQFHTAMKFVAPVRRALGFRTIFNLLGPLANPAGVKRQLVGVYDAEMIVPMAESLRRLGAEKAWVVHGADGLDELSTTGQTDVVVLSDGRLTTRTLVPEDANIRRARLSEIAGGTPQENASALMRLLDGERGAYRDIVLLNSAGALIVAGKVHSLTEGVEIAARSLDTGAARRSLDRLIATTNKVRQ
jgi:anthranilate phosphoribosyltransferase